MNDTVTGPVTAAHPSERRSTRRAGRRAWTAVVVAGSAAVLLYGFIEGQRFNERDPRIKLGAGPLVGEWRTRLNMGTLVMVLVSLAIAWWWPRIVDPLRTRWMVLCTGLAAMAFTMVLLINDPPARIIEPVDNRTEYWQALKTAPPVGEFIDTYVERLPKYSVHLRGHPPGYTALLLVFRSLGLTSPWVVAVLSWVAVGVSAAAVLVAVVRLAGGEVATRAAPFVAVIPAAMWAGTSADAVYQCVGALGIAALAVAVTSQRGRISWGAAGVAGVLLGLLCFGTYGGVMLAPIALAVVVAKRRWTLIVPVLAGGIAVVAAWWWAGFWWLDGAHATRKQYWGGTAQFRTGGQFAAFNIAALLVALGPVVVWSLTRVRRQRLNWLVGGAIVAVAASTISQYSKGEVERIWLLFFPWIAVHAAVLTTATRWRQAAIAVQAFSAIALQTLIVSKW